MSLHSLTQLPVASSFYFNGPWRLSIWGDKFRSVAACDAANITAPETSMPLPYIQLNYHQPVSRPYLPTLWTPPATSIGQKSKSPKTSQAWNRNRESRDSLELIRCEHSLQRAIAGASSKSIPNNNGIRRHMKYEDTSTRCRRNRLIASQLIKARRADNGQRASDPNPFPRCARTSPDTPSQYHGSEAVEAAWV